MTEAEWIACEDPRRMLALWHKNETVPGWRYSVRLARLFACACVRRSWPILRDRRSRLAVEVAERHADGWASQAEVDATIPVTPSRWGCVLLTNVREAAEWAVWHSECPPAIQASLLREIIGNPFGGTVSRLRAYQPVHDWITWNGGVVFQLAKAAYEERPARLCPHCTGRRKLIEERISPSTILADPIPVWSDEELDRPIKLNVERKLVDCPTCHGTGHLDDGTLDPDRLAILADALEDAGCSDEALLMHLRNKGRCGRCETSLSLPKGEVRLVVSGTTLTVNGEPTPAYLPQCIHCQGTGWRPLPGPHVRGCWVLDLLLGKS